MLCLDSPLIRRITLMSCNRALLMSCKAIFNTTTLHDRILVVLGENNIHSHRKAFKKAVDAGAGIEIIQSLLDNCSFDASFLAEELREACWHGNPEIVKRLLEAGADARAQNSGALIVACRYGGHPENVKHLLDAGADVHTQDNRALITSCLNGHPENVERLLEAGADVNARNSGALIVACRYGRRREIVKHLLDAGADVHAQSNRALIAACLNGHSEIVQCLLEAGADVQAQDNMALINACWRGHPDIVQQLLDAGADAHAQDRKAFMVATGKTIAKLLRESTSSM